MKLLKQHQKLREEIFNYFGYVEDWIVYPLANSTEYYWRITENREVLAGTEQSILQVDSDDLPLNMYYQFEIYTDRHLKKSVYRRKDYTMILIDTRTDGNKFLMVFDNTKERPCT